MKKRPAEEQSTFDEYVVYNLAVHGAADVDDLAADV